MLHGPQRSFGANYTRIGPTRVDSNRRYFNMSLQACLVMWASVCLASHVCQAQDRNLPRPQVNATGVVNPAGGSSHPSDHQQIPGVANPSVSVIAPSVASLAHTGGWPSTDAIIPGRSSLPSSPAASLVQISGDASVYSASYISEERSSLSATSYLLGSSQMGLVVSTVSAERVPDVTHSIHIVPMPSSMATESVVPSTSSTVTKSSVLSTNSVLSPLVVPFTQSTVHSISSMVTESSVGSTNLMMTQSVVPSTSSMMTQSVVPSMNSILTQSVVPSTSSTVTQSVVPSMSSMVTQSDQLSTSFVATPPLVPSPSSLMTQSLDSPVTPRLSLASSLAASSLETIPAHTQVYSTEVSGRSILPSLSTSVQNQTKTIIVPTTKSVLLPSMTQFPSSLDVAFSSYSTIVPLWTASAMISTASSGLIGASLSLSTGTPTMLGSIRPSSTTPVHASTAVWSSQSAPVLETTSQSALVLESTSQSVPVLETTSQSAPVLETTSQSAPVLETTSQSAPVLETTSQSAPVLETTSQSAPVLETTSLSIQPSSSVTQPPPTIHGTETALPTAETTTGRPSNTTGPILIHTVKTPPGDLANSTTTDPKPTKPGSANDIEDKPKDKTTIAKPIPVFEHSTPHSTPSRPTTFKPYTTRTVATYGTLPPQPSINYNDILATEKNPAVLVSPGPTAWVPPYYIVIRLQMTWNEFCLKMDQFQAMLSEALTTAIGKHTDRDQIVLHNVQYCQGLYASTRRLGKRGGEIQVQVYAMDVEGAYSVELTHDLAEYLAREGGLLSLDKTDFKDKVLDISGHGKKPGEPTGVQESPRHGLELGVLVAIVIVAIIATLLVSLLTLQLMIWRRRRNVKKMRHSCGNRYSIDTRSLSEAIQLSSVSNHNYAYINPGLVTEEKDYSSNLVDFNDLTVLVNDTEVLEDEFLMLPNPMQHLSDIPLGAEDKNRYANVIPNPQTRVKLSPDEEGSDYINANFVRGYLEGPKCYIATQAPLEQTRADFWRMVWEQHCQVIIMLTGLEEHGLSKCTEYFPNTDGGDTVRVYGHCEIIQERREVRPEWIMSTLTLKHLQEHKSQTVYHFWLSAWPINGLPDIRTVFKFLAEVRPYMEDSNAPTVIHCSPGTGRTGTLIAIDIQTLSYDDSLAVDILQCVNMLRQDRAGSVQTKEQYAFIYKVVHEYARMQHTSCRSSIASGRSSVTSLTPKASTRSSASDLALAE